MQSNNTSKNSTINNTNNNNEKFVKTVKTQQNNKEKEILELIMICLHEEKEKPKEKEEKEIKNKERIKFLQSVLTFLEKNVNDCLVINNENILSKLFKLFEKYLFRVSRFISKSIYNEAIIN